MLGALIASDQIPADLVASVDLVVISGPMAFGRLHAMRQAGVPTLILVRSADEVAAAVAAGFDGVLAEADSGLETTTGVDAVLGERGRARLVTSPEAARQAFASGAQLVICDVPALVAGVLATLRDSRPITGATTDREPFVLLSGMLGDATLWDGIAAHLGDIVLPWPARIDLDDSIQEMATSVLAEAPPRFALGGHSLGAIVALEMMRQAPERVTRLALINASARGPAQAQQQTWARWRQRTADGGFDQVAAELAMATIGEPGRDDETLVAANARMARTVGAGGFVRQLSAQSTRPDSRDGLAAIGVPVLVVSGERDQICPAALQRELLQHCPQATLVSISGAGHMLPLQAPDALAALIRTWITADEPGVE